MTVMLRRAAGDAPGKRPVVGISQYIAVDQIEDENDDSISVRNAHDQGKTYVDGVLAGSSAQWDCARKEQIIEDAP